MGSKAFDRIFGTIVFGLALFFAPFCAGWWLSYLFGSGSNSFLHIGIALGAAGGVAANLFWLKRLVAGLYSMNTWAMLCLLVLYSISLFGFFMGVPVFNVLAGILTGIYIGRQAKMLNYDAAHFSARLKIAQYVALSLLLLVCVTSAILALSDPHTAANLEGMFSLSFSLTTPVLVSIIFIGGTILLLAQFVLTKVSATLAYKS